MAERDRKKPEKRGIAWTGEELHGRHANSSDISYHNHKPRFMYMGFTDTAGTYPDRKH